MGCTKGSSAAHEFLVWKVWTLFMFTGERQELELQISTWTKFIPALSNLVIDYIWNKVFELNYFLRLELGLMGSSCARSPKFTVSVSWGILMTAQAGGPMSRGQSPLWPRWPEWELEDRVGVTFKGVISSCMSRCLVLYFSFAPDCLRDFKGAWRRWLWVQTWCWISQ